MGPLHIILSLRYLAWQRKAAHRDLKRSEVTQRLTRHPGWWKGSWKMGSMGREQGWSHPELWLVALCWVVCVCTLGGRWEFVRCQSELRLSRNNKKWKKERKKKVNNPQALGPFWLAILHPSLQTTCATADCSLLQIASPCLLEKALLCFWLSLHSFSAISPLLGGGSLQCIMHDVI